MKTFFMMMSLVAVLVLVECAVVAAVPVLIPEANVGATPDRPITEEELNLGTSVVSWLLCCFIVVLVVAVVVVVVVVVVAAV